MIVLAKNEKLLKTKVKRYEYIVNTNGEVFRYGASGKKKLAPKRDLEGYLPISIDGKRTRTHRIIAKEFIPNPDNKPVVNHINGIKTDNRVENLEWCTHLENSRHAIKSGLTNNVGDDHPRSIMTSEKVILAREMNLYCSKSFSKKWLAKCFKISAPNMCDIILRKTWKHV